jgi:hypothetical protein
LPVELYWSSLGARESRSLTGIAPDNDIRTTRSLRTLEAQTEPFRMGMLEISEVVKKVINDLNDVYNIYFLYKMFL